MSFLSELFQFLKARKKFWLIPLLLCLLIIGGLLIVGSGTVVCPFIYTLF